MVAKLDRLTRSVHDATGLMLAADKGGWGLVALDAPVDTTTPQGAATFSPSSPNWSGASSVSAQKAALAVKRAQGVRLGRPPTLSAEARAHRGRPGGRRQLVVHRR
jgi:DNA invertase Pin-like site-specific DNA recombinase